MRVPADFINNNKIAFNDIIGAEYQEEIWDTWQVKLKEKATIELEYPITTKSGQIRWVWERGCGIYSDDGKLLFLEGFITDITEQKQAEAELKESEEKYRAIVENNHDAIYIYKGGKFLFVNDKTSDL
ncbi:MAG: hypothetical protein B6I19_01935, partial [Bacteroidetes bacterium 4572_114]